MRAATDGRSRRKSARGADCVVPAERTARACGPHAEDVPLPVRRQYARRGQPDSRFPAIQQVIALAIRIRIELQQNAHQHGTDPHGSTPRRVMRQSKPEAGAGLRRQRCARRTSPRGRASRAQ